MRVTGEARQHRRLVAERDVQRVDQQDCVFLPRIIAAAEDMEVEQLGLGNAKTVENGLPQSLRRMVQRQLQFVQSQHREVSIHQGERWRAV